MNYIYLKSNSPNLDQLHLDIQNSLMSNKNINYCVWNSLLNELIVYWFDELCAEDKNILDNLVLNI